MVICKSILAFLFLLFLLASSGCIFDSPGLGFVILRSSRPPHGCSGSPYYFKFEADGGTRPYTWSTVTGSLPTGLKLSTDGILSGTPKVNGTFTFRIQAANADNETYNEEYIVTIGDFAITSNDYYIYYCPGIAIDYPLKTCGGTPPFSWAVSSGTLPAGISLTAKGHITGSSTATGDSVVTIQAADSAGKTAEKEFIISGSNLLVITSSRYLADGQTSVAYAPVQLLACGGSGSYSWTSKATSASDLPPGMILASNGIVSGTPTKAGKFSFYIEAKDTIPPNHIAMDIFYMTVKASPLAIATTSPLADASECIAYAATLKASGGSGAYTWHLGTGSKLPAGLSLDSSSGQIYGTPSMPQATPYSFTIVVNDAMATVSKTFQLAVNEDLSVSADLEIPEVRHGAAAYNHIQTGKTNLPVRVDFRFKTAGILKQTVNKATLQVVGDCSTISTTTISTVADVNGDGKNERTAQFNGVLVMGLVSAAGKSAGDTATLRVSIDMVVDGKAVTYVGGAKVTLD